MAPETEDLSTPAPSPAASDSATSSDGGSATSAEDRLKKLPPWLVANPPQTPEEVAAERVSKELGERLEHPCMEVRHIARLIGIEALERLFQRTMEIEAQGGLLAPVGHRRRTPGGVFFLLAAEVLNDADHLAVFGRERSFQRERYQIVPVPADSPLPPVSPKQLAFRQKHNKRPRAAATRAAGTPPPPSPPPNLPLPPPGERADMTVPGKLELTLKINALPTKTHTDKNGWKVFWVACGAQQVEIKLRPKFFTKLTEAAAQWPRWGAALTGQMGPATSTGFELLNASVKTFEIKEKEKPDDPAAT